MVANVERDDWAAATALEREARPLEEMSVTKDAVSYRPPKISGNHSSVTMDPV